MSSMNKEIKNPIIPGFYPDPSICRVEDDFYLVTSSFSYFPGVPVFHSRDLMNWEQIGHVLDRPSQLPLDSRHISGGIFAPTIRYHEGIFYMITTNINHGGNFIVTAKEPSGPWSEPHWIENAEGIDPSLFWDEDGKAYFTGTTGFGRKEPQMIWISEIDLKSFALVGDKKEIWGGALVHCWCPEAPHLYKRNSWYYLMIAEGGTEHYHAVTIARSKNIWGPYQGYAGNPILTHRHLGERYPICNTGHGDLVELKDGSWYMVMLASRIYGGYHKNLGRETFIAPVSWENDWPIVSPGTGKVEWTYPAPSLPPCEVQPIPERDDFLTEELGFQWNFLGTPVNEIHRVEDSCLKLRTIARPVYPDNVQLSGYNAPVEAISFLGRRQQHMSFTVKAQIDFSSLADRDTTGLLILQNAFHEMRMEIAAENGRKVVRVMKGYTVKKDTGKQNDAEQQNHTEYRQELCGQIDWCENTAILLIRAREQNYCFEITDKEGNTFVICSDLNGGYLGSESAGGFVGAYIGMFASGNGIDTGNYISFDWFDYIPGE